MAAVVPPVTDEDLDTVVRTLEVRHHQLMHDIAECERAICLLYTSPSPRD